MRLSKIKLFFICLLSTTVLLPFYIFAEENVSSPIRTTSVGVEVSPTNPGPNENVKITLSSYSFDIDKAYIEWKSGGKILISGYGKKVYSFTTGQANTDSVFDISIKPFDQPDIINKKVSIETSEIDLLWEATNSYVPPFYKGKAFPPQEGDLKIVAIPNTPKTNMTYSWARRGESQKESSGFNKNSFSFKGSELYQSEEIGVSISSVDSRYSSEKSIIIETVNPKILFYKKSPTEGVLYNNALTNNYTMLEDEATIVAEPFFFSLTNGKNLLSYIWKVNGKSIETPLKKSEVTIRPSSRGGEATIGVIIENTRTFLQKASNILKLTI